jgi:Flp pilus assembly pilin Flp
MKRKLRSFWHDDKGQDLAEYTLLAAALVVLTVIIGTSAQVPMLAVLQRCADALALGASK